MGLLLYRNCGNVDCRHYDDIRWSSSPKVRLISISDTNCSIMLCLSIVHAGLTSVQYTAGVMKEIADDNGHWMTNISVYLGLHLVPHVVLVYMFWFRGKRRDGMIF